MTNPTFAIVPLSDENAEELKARLRLLQRESLTVESGDRVFSFPLVTGATINGDQCRFTLSKGVADQILAAMDGREVIAAAGRLVGKTVDTAMTLSEKQNLLAATVALPTSRDWQLLVDDYQLVESLNTVLAQTLADAKAGKHASWEQIGAAVFGQIQAFVDKFPDAGILDSEGYLTVSRFFAVNYDPAMYNFLRYYTGK